MRGSLLSRHDMWHNRSVERRLLQGINQPLAVVTGAVPTWVARARMLRLFSPASRNRLLKLMGFGVGSIVEMQSRVQAFDRGHRASVDGGRL